MVRPVPVRMKALVLPVMRVGVQLVMKQLALLVTKEPVVHVTRASARRPMKALA
jgi:hypothetical protein